MGYAKIRELFYAENPEFFGQFEREDKDDADDGAGEVDGGSGAGDVCS